VTGEGFYYLGRSYRLLLVDDQVRALKLEHGRFKLLRSRASEGRSIFVRWYGEHAEAWLRRRLGRWVDRVDARPSGLNVRDLGYRWGSCGKSKRLNFNWRIILLPPDAIDYLIVHELAHLHEPSHSRAFWQHVERAMPDYDRRKDWLAVHGATFVTLDNPSRSPP
jgi:predicted metal-dependent hydrolase